MCLILTIVAAVFFTAWHVAKGGRGLVPKSVSTAMLMFWAAALMWSVDGIASVLEGESFFDISKEDGILGVIIIACGCAVFGILCLFERKKKAAACS